MAIQTPTGRTFPGNCTIIPSLKKWVFHAIYCLAFLSLYGECICSLNWLVLNDKEDVEYRSFENLIVMHSMFGSSTVMLCTFHAIWQPFKRDIYHLLPSKNTKNGKLVELTEVGRSWGKKTFYAILIFNFIILIFTYFVFIGSDIYLWYISPSGLCIRYQVSIWQVNCHFNGDVVLSDV